MKIILSRFTRSLILSLLVLMIVMPFISARVTIDSNPSYTQATVVSFNHICMRDPWVGWKNPSGFYTANILWTDSNYVCYYEDGMAQDLFHEDKNCCPSGYTCNQNTGDASYNKCEESAIKKCSDYTPLGEAACEGDDNTTHVGISDIESFKGAGYCSINKQQIYGSCVRDVICDCKWENNRCYSDYQDLACNGPGSCINYSTSLPNGFCDNTVPPLGICVTDIKVTDNCNTTNQKIVEWTKYRSDGNSLSTDDCTDHGIKTYPCLGSVLPFFGISAAVILIVLVIAYYFWMKNRKSRKKSKKR